VKKAPVVKATAKPAKVVAPKKSSSEDSSSEEEVVNIYI